MEFWHQVAVAAEMGGAYAWVMAGEIALALLLAAAQPRDRTRLRAAVLLLLASIVGTLLAALVLDLGPVQGSGVWFELVHLVAQLLYAIGTVLICGTLLFGFLLPRTGMVPAPILVDALFGLTYVAVALFLLAHHGVNLSGIIATSAVLTAVIGLSVQDTLGNVIGGFALQAERSVAVGDWVRVGDIEGRVRETRWRQTSIETRDWDTVIIPNGMLLKSTVIVLGRRDGIPRPRRVLVPFGADARHSPEEVIATIHRAFQGVEVPNVAADPAPLCILSEFHEGVFAYILVYWALDIAKLPFTSSEVRRRIVTALRRDNLALAVSTQRVFLFSDTGDAGPEKGADELERRKTALEAAELLAPLTEDERMELAARLTTAQFHAGELISRQGEAADYLYLLTEGEATVRVANTAGATSRVAILRSGDIFGEIGMVTGEPRTATVQARTDVLCYRLDKAAFQGTLRSRPEIAEAISHLLAQRRLELDGVVSGLDANAARIRIGQEEKDILQRIRRFFLLT